MEGMKSRVEVGECGTKLPALPCVHQPENSSHTSRGFMGVHYVGKIMSLAIGD